MIDPASMGDWVQAAVMVGALGGLGAACGWVLGQGELAVGGGGTIGRVPVAARPSRLPCGQAGRRGVGGNRG
jgi:hypothetical protein